MPRKILIMGGARFHGLQLARHFSKIGDEVYVLNRGRFKPSYDFEVKHLKADRDDKEQLKKALGDKSFDVVIDNNAYNTRQVRLILELIKGRCKHYVFTSSTSLYLMLSSGHRVRENEVRGFRERFYHPEVKNYAMNKLFAELTLLNYREGINFTSLRIPIVFGEGDFTGKLLYFYSRFKDGGKLLLDKEVKKFSIIYAKDIVTVYDKIVLNEKCYNKVINCADPQAYDYGRFFSKIFGGIYSKDKLVLIPAEELWNMGHHCSLTWGPEVDLSLFFELLGGIKFTPIEEWGKPSLKWYISNHSDKMESSEFKEIRRKELELIRGLEDGK